MPLLSIILLAILPVTTAVAGDLSIVINGRSHHFDSSYDWNENNFGLGLEYQFETTSRWKKIVMANGFRIDASSLAENLEAILDGNWPSGQRPPLWDGKTAERAVAALKKRVGS